MLSPSLQVVRTPPYTHIANRTPPKCAAWSNICHPLTKPMTSSATNPPRACIEGRGRGLMHVRWVIWWWRSDNDNDGHMTSADQMYNDHVTYWCDWGNGHVIMVMVTMVMRWVLTSCNGYVADVLGSWHGNGHVMVVKWSCDHGNGHVIIVMRCHGDAMVVMLMVHVICFCHVSLLLRPSMERKVEISRPPWNQDCLRSPKLPLQILPQTV